jgi:hypothetical protein
VDGWSTLSSSCKSRHPNKHQSLSWQCAPPPPPFGDKFDGMDGWTNSNSIPYCMIPFPIDKEGDIDLGLCLWTCVQQNIK